MKLFVRMALFRPYTFTVLAILIVVFGALAVFVITPFLVLSPAHALQPRASVEQFLLTEAPYRQGGKDRARAELESRYLAELAADIIRDRHPHLAHKLHIRSIISSKETCGVTLVESLLQSLAHQVSALAPCATTRQQH